MHAFFILGGLLHATVLAIIGFFVLFTASKAQGLVRQIGNLLGAWLYILAVLAIIASVAFAAAGPGFMRSHHAWMYSGALGAGPPPAAPPANTATNAATTK